MSSVYIDALMPEHTNQLSLIQSVHQISFKLFIQTDGLNGIFISESWIA